MRFGRLRATALHLVICTVAIENQWYPPARLGSVVRQMVSPSEFLVRGIEAGVEAGGRGRWSEEGKEKRRQVRGVPAESTIR